MDNTDKVVTLLDEARRMKLKVEPPDVNFSQFMFTVSGERTIRYGLGAIKGVGQNVVDELVESTKQRAVSRPAGYVPAERCESNEPSRAGSVDPLRRGRFARRQSCDADAFVALGDAARRSNHPCAGASARTTCSV